MVPTLTIQRITPLTMPAYLHAGLCIIDSLRCPRSDLCKAASCPQGKRRCLERRVWTRMSRRYFRPTRCSRVEPLRGQFRALRERFELRPGDLRMHAPAEPTVGRSNDLVGADRLGEAQNPVRDDLRMLDEIGR